MSEHREEYLDLCAGHALGCLESADAARLEAHLAVGCAECEAALRDFSEATTLLAGTAPVMTPPVELRARVLQAARGAVVTPGSEGAPVLPAAQARQRDERIVAIDVARARQTATIGWLVAALLAALVLWTGTSVVRLRQRVAAKDTQIASLERERVDLQERLTEAGRWVGVVTAADARVAVLAPTPAGDAALRGRAIVDPATQRAIVTFSHMRAPEGRAYELWTIRGGKPRSLGLIDADATGSAMLQLDIGDATTLEALAVSLEPAGGSPSKEAPSGPVVMVGALGG